MKVKKFAIVALSSGFVLAGTAAVFNQKDERIKATLRGFGTGITLAAAGKLLMSEKRD